MATRLVSTCLRIRLRSPELHLLPLALVMVIFDSVTLLRPGALALLAFQPLKVAVAITDYCSASESSEFRVLTDPLN